MHVRKNVSSLTTEERSRLVNALLQLKDQGEYDHFVHTHHQIMVPPVLPHEPRDANYRNPGRILPSSPTLEDLNIAK